jgi:hypothetical protein
MKREPVKIFHRTSAQRLAIGVGVLAVLAFIGAGAVSFASGIVIQSKDTSHTVVGTISTVHVDVDGDIDVQTGPPGQIRVAVHRVWSFQEPTVTETRTGTDLSISAACHGVDWGTCSTTVHLVVPVSAALTLTSSDGNVSVNAVQGVLNPEGGSVPASGSLNLTSDNGDVTGTGLAAAQVQASSDNGNVSLSFGAVPVTVNASSDHGNVSVLVPHGPTSYVVLANTDNGHLSVDVPNNPTADRHIVVDSEDGDVSVGYHSG